MRIANFRADADIVGRRIKVAWEFLLDAGETLASIPSVTVRRKTRDFEFPPPPAQGSDPFLLYDSRAFPPATGNVLASDLPGWESRAGDTRTVVSVVTVAQLVDGVAVEWTRRTTANTFNAAGVPLSQRVEILDTGDAPDGLQPGTTYYYQIASPLIPNAALPEYRVTATAGEGYALNRTLYEMLPTIYRRHDVTARVPTPGAEAVPEAANRSGQLRRFLDPFGASLDAMRSAAENLRGLHDLDNVDARFLPLMAGWIGWDLNFDASIPLQRHEIKYAPALYRINGTIPACLIWVKRLTGWSCRVKEFFPNVFFSNDMGLLERPDDHGSRTVNTADAELLANIGTPDDKVDYTYDTGTSDQDWYAYNVVGLFVFPPDAEPANAIARKREKLKRNLSRFMPVNIRGVVILQAPKITEAPSSEELNLLEIGD
ncbi:MAG: hypothetical protein HY741_03510 [Chloroflexi bacterium]|nr:hypothetical protein [Chloroflexota bacterium]